MTVPVRRTDYTAKRCGNAARARRPVAPVTKGHSRQDTAKAQNMDRQTLRDWAHREFGPDGLSNRPKSRRNVFLDEDQLKVISDWLEKGPNPETDGLVRWGVREIKNKIQTNFGVKYPMERTRWLMRLDFRHVSQHPFHPKAKPRRNSVGIFKTS